MKRIIALGGMLAAVGAVLAWQAPEIRRYLKVRAM
jgi:fucose permease